MTRIERLIERISREGDCAVYAAAGIPKPPDDRLLPEDLKEFFGLCGGCSLFESSAYNLNVRADKFARAHDVVTPRISDEVQLITNKALPMTWDWYLLGEGDSLQFILMDLHLDRLGFCYDAFWDIYPNNCTLIAKSFSEFLERWVDNMANELYWTKPGNNCQLARDLV